MTYARDLLIYLSVKYNGDWVKIYDSILAKEDVPINSLLEVKEKIKCGCITILDSNYPEPLKNIMRPPFVLFYYGDISLLNNYDISISVVGSRKYSKYGKECTEKIIKELNGKYIIVSGLAMGIDTIAHKAAINSGAKTIAILGCGIDRCYPTDNQSLYEEIKQNHLMVSEYPLDTNPDKEHFPMRNRLIAGISYGLLVAEAKEKSGTLITSMFANEFGREVMCIPYPIDAESQCNRLIQSGAALVQSAEDVRIVMEHLWKIS